MSLNNKEKEELNQYQKYKKKKRRSVFKRKLINKKIWIFKNKRRRQRVLTSFKMMVTFWSNLNNDNDYLII